MADDKTMRDAASLLAYAVMDLHLGPVGYVDSLSVRDWEVAGNPEWGKLTHRWIRDWIAEHGRPSTWPWKDPFFDQFETPQLESGTGTAI